MRIFVGTLYTIENEFLECVASIRRQSHRDFQHFVFRDLPNKEAHELLYRTFMQRAHEFDLLVKVDADMVIENEDLFVLIAEKFRANAWLKDLEIAVHDFFSDQLIWGMHTYRNTVRWQSTDEDLFTDACPVQAWERIHDDSELAPAAVHCQNPSAFQAFHYGVHRALKMVQPGRVRVRPSHARYHWDNLQRTRHNFLRTRDSRIGFALLGAELVFKGGIKPEHLSYSNPFLQTVFEPYVQLDADTLERETRRISMTSFGYLPGKLRRVAITGRFRRQALTDSVARRKTRLTQ